MPPIAIPIICGMEWYQAGVGRGWGRGWGRGDETGGGRNTKREPDE